MANITKRGEKYLIRVSVGRDTEGKQLTESTTYTPTETTPKKIEKEVENFARDFEERVRNGKYLEGEKITFCDFLERWREDYAVANISKGVLEGYESAIKKRFIPTIGNIKLSKINALHLQSIYTDMRKEGKATSTIRRNHAIASSIFSHAYKWGIIQENICQRVELPKQKENSHSMNCFDVRQAETFLHALTLTYTDIYRAHTRIDDTGKPYNVPEYTQEKTIPLQFQTFFNLALYGGFRRGELVALKWNDINYKKNSISISKSAAKVKAGQIIKAPKTKSGIREITLPYSCIAMLKELQTEQKKMIIKYGSAWEGNSGKDISKNFVFTQELGTMMSLDTPTHKFKEIIDRYNGIVKDESEKLPIIRLHDLRHTSATLLISQNVDIRTVANRLGHSKTSVTLDIYSHALKELDEKASDVLEGLIIKKA